MIAYGVDANSALRIGWGPSDEDPPGYKRQHEELIASNDAAGDTAR